MKTKKILDPKTMEALRDLYLKKEIIIGLHTKQMLECNRQIRELEKGHTKQICTKLQAEQINEYKEVLEERFKNSYLRVCR